MEESTLFAMFLLGSMGIMLFAIVGIMGSKYLQHKREMAEIQSKAQPVVQTNTELAPEVTNRIEALEKKCEQLSEQVEGLQQSLQDEQRALDQKLNAVLGDYDQSAGQEENVRIKA